MYSDKLISVFVSIAFFSLILQKFAMLSQVGTIFILLTACSLFLAFINSLMGKKKISREVFFFISSILLILLLHSVYTFFDGNFYSLSLIVKVIIFSAFIVISVACSNNDVTISILTKNIAYISLASSVFGILILIFGATGFKGANRVIELFGMYQYADGIYPFYRISGFFDNANSAGIIALFGIVSFSHLKCTSSSSSIISLYIYINILFIFLTGSRTALLLTILYFGLLNANRWSLSAIFKMILLTLPLIVLTINYLYSSGIDVSLYFESRMNDGLTSRDIAWGYLYDWFIEKPLGIGLGYAEYLLIEDVKLGFGSHSGHLALITELGIILYSILMSVFIFAMIHNYKRRYLISNAFLVYTPFIIMIHQIIERGIFQITHHFFLLLMIIVIGFNKGKRNEYSCDNVS